MTTAADSNKITLSLDAADYDRLKAAAALEGVSVVEYCRDTIKEQLDEDEIFRAPIKLTQEYAERIAQLRKESARAEDANRAPEPAGGREPSGMRAAMERLATLRKESAGAGETERASEPTGGREPSGRLAAMERLAALRKESAGGKKSLGDSADDIRQMREERARNLERAAKGRRRRKPGD